MAKNFVLDSLMAPDSIAVIGVSGDASKAALTGATGLMKNLIKFGFEGPIYPVNPKYDSIMGYATYPDVASLPAEVDTIAIGIQSQQVIEIVKQSIEKGIKSAVVITSGFAETNTEEGIRLQQELKQLSEEHDFPICGPNCLGIVNAHRNVACSTSAGLWIEDFPKGHVGLVSQSGALSSAFLGRGETLGTGFSYLVTAGNEASVEISDYIQYLAKDPATYVVAAFIEGIRDTGKFIQAAAACRKADKPLVVFKVGKSERAARSA